MKKLIEKSKDRLQLIVSKSPQGEDRHRSSHNRPPRDDEGEGKLCTERLSERERVRERERERERVGERERERGGERERER